MKNFVLLLFAFCLIGVTAMAGNGPGEEFDNDVIVKTEKAVSFDMENSLIANKVFFADVNDFTKAETIHPDLAKKVDHYMEYDFPSLMETVMKQQENVHENFLIKIAED